MVVNDGVEIFIVYGEKLLDEIQLEILKPFLFEDGAQIAGCEWELLVLGEERFDGIVLIAEKVEKLLINV